MEGRQKPTVRSKRPEPPSPIAAIVAIVPRLRRFGIMLLGTRKLADKATSEMLSRFIQFPDVLEETPTEEIECLAFRSFLQTINSGAIEIVDTRPCIDPTLNYFQSLTGTERMFFLLRYVENFSAEDITDIMDVSGDEALMLERQAIRKLGPVLSATAGSGKRNDGAPIDKP